MKGILWKTYYWSYLLLKGSMSGYGMLVMFQRTGVLEAANRKGGV